MSIKRVTAIVAGSILFILTTNAQDDGEGRGRHQKLSERLAVLSSAERAKYHAARKQAMTNPEVAAAAERRKKADEEYRKLMRREILKIDPSLGPLLDMLAKLRKHDNL